MINSPIEDRPGYHPTLRQSIENPAQQDRLPEGQTLSLEHRTRVSTPAERRAIMWSFAWQIGWRLALLVLGKVLSY